VNTWSLLPAVSARLVLGVPTLSIDPEDTTCAFPRLRPPPICSKFSPWRCLKRLSRCRDTYRRLSHTTENDRGRGNLLRGTLRPPFSTTLSSTISSVCARRWYSECHSAFSGPHIPCLLLPDGLRSIRRPFNCSIQSGIRIFSHIFIALQL
jgi:hypothetical protein